MRSEEGEKAALLFAAAGTVSLLAGVYDAASFAVSVYLSGCFYFAAVVAKKFGPEEVRRKSRDN